MNEKIALILAASAGKVVDYATILHAQNFEVAALLESTPSQRALHRE